MHERREHAPGLINDPDGRVRLLLHVLVNWSVPAATLLVAWHLEEYLAARLLAVLALVATVAVWIGFNFLHRRMNRLRNLSLSTSIAAVLCTGCLALLLP